MSKALYWRGKLAYDRGSAAAAGTAAGAASDFWKNASLHENGGSRWKI